MEAPSESAMNVIRWAKEAEITGTTAQTAMMWNRLDPDFQDVQTKPTPDTTLENFIEQLDAKRETQERNYARERPRWRLRG
ncbi:hypothetical protein LTR60_001587 [Cryomyces antarcticus]|nr:hypothetical protein LTR39_004194 [Cryomyces antarcticus]KAK5018232.1 hypothetical protein LTR60_001587 [Cryomyces antarcticus]